MFKHVNVYKTTKKMYNNTVNILQEDILVENNELLNFELLHRHIIGDIEKGTDEKIKEYGKYFFQNEAYRLFKKVDAIHVKTENGQKPVSNSVLAVTGERGSGKTSFLKTIEKELNKQKGYYTFPVIDPSSLHGDLNILEIVCTHIDIIIEEKRQKGHYVDTTLAEYRKIKNDLSKIILAADTDHKQSDNGLQRLDENRKKVQFDENFTKLLISFLQLINQDDQINNKKEKCILLIDDLDLVEDKVIYELTEHIRKYFNGQMIVILTYKEEQLNDVLLKDKMIKEKDLKEYTDKEKLKDQCQKYIEKLIPYEHRVRLKNHKDFYGMNAEACFQEMIRPMLEEGTFEWEIYKPKFFPGNIVNENDTLKQWFEKMTFYKSKVNIKAVDKLEQVDTAFANNLRGIIQWIETIYNMEVLNQEKLDTGDRDEWEKLKRNVELVRTRIIRTTFELLKEDQRHFLERWQNTLVGAKLYQAYFYFGEISLEKFGADYLNDMVDHRQIKPNNVSLADVIKMISIYKLAKPTEGLLIYVFKVLYSCELIDKYIKCYINKNENNVEIREDKINDYIELLRRDIIPNTKPIFSLNRPGGSLLNQFTFTGYLNENSIKENKKEIESILISTYSIRGKLYGQLRPKYNGVRDPKVQSTYFGQEFFKMSTIVGNNTSYLWNPLTIISTNDYLMNSLNMKGYVLISLFDLDYFLENWRYSINNVEKEKVIALIDDILKGDTSMNFFTDRLLSKNETEKKHVFLTEEIMDIIVKYPDQTETDSEKNNIMEVLIMLEKNKKQQILRFLTLLREEFIDDNEMKIKISTLENKIQRLQSIKSFTSEYLIEAKKLFEKSSKYNLILGNNDEK